MIQKLVCESCKTKAVNQESEFGFKTNFRQTLSEQCGSYTAAREVIYQHELEYRDKITKCRCNDLYFLGSASIGNEHLKSKVSMNLENKVIQFLETKHRNAPQCSSLLSLCVSIQTASDIDYARSKLWMVTELNLYNSKFDKLPDVLGNVLPNLNKIILEMNRRTNLPETITSCSGPE